MSFLGGFIGGAADQATGILNKRMQDESTLSAQQAFAEFNAAVDIKKQKTLARLRQEMADEPLNRIGKKAKELEGQEVPMEPQAVKDLGGTAGMGGLISGMKGGYKALKAQANELPEQDRKPYLDQLDKQFAAEQTAAQEKVKGQTRKRTADEALAAALEHAKLNDLPAYAAYDSTIGRTDREDRRVDSLERKDDMSEKKNDEETADRRRRADWLQTHQTAALDLQREIARGRADRGGSDDNDPSPVKTAKWLAANKNDPVMMDAWEKANRTKSKDVDGIAADFMAKDPMMTAQEAVTKASQLIAAARGGEKETGKPVTPDRPAPNQAAIDRLIKNPDKASDFDALFGKGAAASVMSNQKPANTTSAQKPSATNPTDKPSGTISSSRNPQTGKTIYTVDGVRGRFNTREDAEDAKKKSGIGKSSMSAMIDKYQD